MTKVRIHSDQMRIFFPIVDHDGATMEIDQTLFDEYLAVFAALENVMDKLEQLYRIQNGLKPLEDLGIPKYEMTKPEGR